MVFAWSQTYRLDEHDRTHAKASSKTQSTPACPQPQALARTRGPSPRESSRQGLSSRWARSLLEVFADQTNPQAKRLTPNARSIPDTKAPSRKEPCSSPFLFES